MGQTEVQTEYQKAVSAVKELDQGHVMWPGGGYSEEVKHELRAAGQPGKVP